MRPAIVARDPDLIKDVLITEFNSFRSNDFNLSKKYDPLLATNPFFTVDDEWREGRKTLIPAVSQNKVKYTQFIYRVLIDFGNTNLCKKKTCKRN